MEYKNTRTLILILSAMAAIAPLSIDMYLPSLPDIATSLKTSLHMVEATVSVFFLGFGIGQFIGGPLSDHYGRVRSVLLGLVLFTVFSSTIFFTESVQFMLIARFFQAFAGGFVMVNTAAIVRDLFEEKESARILSNIASIMMIAPMVAPLLGSAIIKWVDWTYIFAFLGAYGCLLFFVVKTNFKTKPKDELPKRLSIGTVLRSYLSVLKHKVGRAYLLTACLVSAGMFAFITKSSSIYMGHFAVSSANFPYFFGANVAAIIIVAQINSRLVRRIDPKKLLKIGLFLNLLSATLLFTYSYFFTANLYMVLALNMVFIASMGFIYGNIDACYLSYFPANTGVANALLGVSKFIVGGFIGLVINSLQSLGLSAPFLVMMLGSFVANAIFYGLINRRSKQSIKDEALSHLEATR